jgi:membrane protease YdiL (CAAX protease family)
VGLRLDRRWLRQFGAGTTLGIASLALAAGLIWAFGGVHFELDPNRSALGLVQGLYVFLCVALFEEALFRGFLFQRLAAGVGVWATQILLAVLFSLGHWGNPGMDGLTMLWASAELGLAALLLGLAYLRTRSLALPVGLHLGWNWAQGTLLGFGVSGFDQTGWLRPVFHGQAEWLSGGNFGPEASIFGVVADLVLIGLLWQWQGSEPTLRHSSPPDPTPSLVLDRS